MPGGGSILSHGLTAQGAAQSPAFVKGLGTHQPGRARGCWGEGPPAQRRSDGSVGERAGGLAGDCGKLSSALGGRDGSREKRVGKSHPRAAPGRREVGQAQERPVCSSAGGTGVQLISLSLPPLFPLPREANPLQQDDPAPSSSAPGLPALPVLASGGVTAAPPALPRLGRVNRPMLGGSPGTHTTRGGSMNSIPADRHLPLALLEDMGKVPETAQHLHHSILMEE